MSSAIGFSEIIVVLLLIVIFTNPKDIPSLVRKTARTAARLRSQVRSFLDDISRE